MPELIAIGVIAERLGISRQRADELSRRTGFPEPTVTVPIRLWEAPLIVRWAKAEGRETVAP